MLKEPLFLSPSLKNNLWGGDTLKKRWNVKSDDIVAEMWEVSVHKDGNSVVTNGEYAGKTLAEVIASDKSICNIKGEFPVLIKFIDAKSDLSVQVHPDDEYAKKFENSNGKTEVWYVIDADEGSGIYCGFKKDVTKEEVEAAISQNKLSDLLNFIEVKAGESYFISAGTVHAIGGGIRICEVQQNSNLTYRVYDYGRLGKDGKPRELHVQKALDVMNLQKYVPQTFGEQSKDGVEIKCIAECDYFMALLYTLNGNKTDLFFECYSTLSAIDGDCTIIIDGKDFSLAEGQSCLIPAKTEYSMKGDCKIILTTV